jgi:hypothetical protein
MARSDDTETQNFADDIRRIRILSFASYRKSLLYAGFKQDRYDNWSLSARYAKANNMFPIHLTEGGQYLNTPDRNKDLKYSWDECRRIWDRASIKYCFNIEGSVKTFVCGSNEDSTFRRKEIHAMLKSHFIEDINGRDHADYLLLYRCALARLNDEATIPRDRRHQRAINHVFHAIAFNEIRQDLAAARANDNQKEISDVLSRVRHLREQQHEDFRRAARPQEMQKLTERLAAEEEMARANPGLNFNYPLLRPAHHQNHLGI